LGRNLLLTVKDVMHNPSKIAKVSPQTSIRKLVIEMTKFPLGAACVMEENKLIGIITDGDLRRALTTNSNLLEMNSEQIMNLNPKTILPELSLGKL
jgi:arabinose-5-phosphate isomerase